MPEVLLANILDIENLVDDTGMTPPVTTEEGNVAVYGSSPSILADGALSITEILGRALHTGTQAISTVTGLQAVIDAAATQAELDAVVTTLEAADDLKLDITGYTAADVLTKLLTVDGAASGLDADLFDGQQSSVFALLVGPTFTGTPSAPTAAPGTNTTQLSTTAFVAAAIAAVDADFDSHTANVSNPHAVTKSQVGLGSADNTSDAGKPVSTATQTALDLKANLASPALTGTPTAPTPTLGDTSTKIATMAALDAALDAVVSGIQWKAPARVLATTNIVKATALENGDTVDGVVLATGNVVALTGQTLPAENGLWTVQASGAAVRTADMNAAAEFPGASFLVTAGTHIDSQWTCNNATNPVVDTDAITIVQTEAGSGDIDAHIANVGNPHAVTKTQVGLANADNTSDAAKPVSTATQTALDLKQAVDTDLTVIAALAPSNDDVIQRKAGAWANRTLAQLKTDLALGTGFATSAEAIAGVITDETINPATLFAYHRNFEGPRPCQYFGVTFDGVTDDTPGWNTIVAAWTADDVDAVQCPAGTSVIESAIDPIVGTEKSLIGAGGASIITIPSGDTRGTFFEFGTETVGIRGFKLSGFDLHCDNATVAATESALLFGRAAEIVVEDMWFDNVGTIAKFGTVSDTVWEVPNQIVLQRFHGSSDRTNATSLINIKVGGGLHFSDWWVSGTGTGWSADTTAAYISIIPSANAAAVDTLFFDRLRMSQYDSGNTTDCRAMGLYALWNAASTGSIVNVWMRGCALDYTSQASVLLSGSSTSTRHGSIWTIANNRFYTGTGKGIVLNNTITSTARQWTDINIHDNHIGIISDSPGLEVVDNGNNNFKNCTAHHNHISDSSAQPSKAYAINVNAEGWDIDENTVGATQSTTSTEFLKSVNVARQLYRTRIGYNPLKKMTAQGSVTSVLGVAATSEETPHFAITKGLVLPQTRVYLEAAQALSHRIPRKTALLYDDVIAMLIEADVWRLLDGLFLYSGETDAPGLQNIKTPGTLTMTATAAPTHTKWRGYTFNGTSQDLNFGALPAAFGQFAQNDASIGVWVRTRGGVNHTIGNAAGDTDAKVRLNTDDGTNMTGRLNADADATIGAVSDGVGLSALSRANSTQVSGYKNGALVATVAQTSVSLAGQTSNNRVGREDNNEWTTDEVSAVFYGAALTAARQAAIYRALHYWQTQVGAV